MEAAAGGSGKLRSYVTRPGASDDICFGGEGDGLNGTG